MNQVIQGDCLEVMKTLEDNSINLTVTSPPYNIGKMHSNKLQFGTYKNKSKYYYYVVKCKTIFCSLLTK